MPVRVLEKPDETGQQQAEPSDENFYFPFPPYDIQLDLMKQAYGAFENNKFALLESPTGTGKSLSLICSALTWLTDFQRRRKVKLETRKDVLIEQIEKIKRDEDASGDWLTSQTKCQDLQRELTSIAKNLDKLINIDQRTQARRQAKIHGQPLDSFAVLDAKLRQNETTTKTITDQRDIQQPVLSSSQGSSQSEVPDEEEDLEKRLKEQQEEEQVSPKVYYASRTHSQLSQFVNEIKRTKFSDFEKGTNLKIIPLASRPILCVNPDVVKLKEPSAINEKCSELQRESTPEKRCPYAKLKQVHRLKEEVLSSVMDIEEIVTKGRSMGSCPYYANRMAISEAEVVILPYNNLLHCETRKASSLNLKDSVVILDEAHNILETISSIHSSPVTGMQLIGSHSILSRYFAKYHNRMNPNNALMVRRMIECLRQLIMFLNDPRSHLDDYNCPKPVESIDVRSPVKLDTNISDTSTTIKTSKPQAAQEEFMLDMNTFIGSAKLHSFNIYKLLDYFNRSQLARKLMGFFWTQDEVLDLSLDISKLDTGNKSSTEVLGTKGKTKPEINANKRRKIAQNEINKVNGKSRTDTPEKQVKDGAKQDNKNYTGQSTELSFLTKSNPDLSKKLDSISYGYPIFSLIEFLKSLTSMIGDGKILVDKHSGNILTSTLKFILLNPSSQFEQMTSEARSIVLAGGTMQPFSEFVDLLFGPLKIPLERLVTFSCDHVIKSNQIFFGTLALGPSNKTLELSYRMKNSLETIDEYGRTVLNLSMICPAGMVCFFPSYEYEQLCFNRWKNEGIINKIEFKSKQVFREPKQANQLKPTLEEFARAIEKGKTSGRGALLLCVVGGKMSEGINFNDDLGRCIIMIGLPFANIKSTELQQKMAHYDKVCSNSSNSTSGKSAGQQYYENLCIKGINQSIGRAVRHRNDYAAILLLDRRYSCKTPIKEGLPTWMTKSLVDYPRFGTMFSQIKNFFDRLSRELPNDNSIGC